MPSSLSLTQAQYKFILWLRLNAWLNPLIERTAPGKPGAASHLERLNEEVQCDLSYLRFVSSALRLHTPKSCTSSAKLLSLKYRRVIGMDSKMGGARFPYLRRRHIT